MKKNILKISILLLAFFCLNDIYAKQCLTVRSAGESDVVGYYEHEYLDKNSWSSISSSAATGQSAANWDSSAEAINYCRNTALFKQGKISCVKSYAVASKKYFCKGTGFNTLSECQKHEYTEAGTWNLRTGFCTKTKGRYKCSFNSRTYSTKGSCDKNCTQYKCSVNQKICTQSNVKKCGACKSETRQCGSLCVNALASCDCSIKYGYIYREKSSGTEKWSVGTGPLKIYRYLTDDNDDIYCIQPGKKGPGSGTRYCINQDFDLSRCKSENHYFCGFAEILYQTVKEDGTYSDGSVKFVDNGKYSYLEITTALRMWVAYAADGAINLSDDEIITGFGEAENDYLNISKTDVYLNTANMVKKGYNGLACGSSVGRGVLCTKNGITIYQKAIELFKNALKAKREFIKYESNISSNLTFNGKADNQGEDTIFTIVAEIPETFQEKMVECTKQEILDKRSDCQVYAELKDENGNIQNVLIEDAKCEGKETCDFVVKAKRKECSRTGGSVVKADGKYVLKVGLKGYSRGGYVREYINDSGADASQIMLTFAFNEKRNEIENESGDVDPDTFATFNYTVNVPCYCNSNKYCDDFRAKGYLKNTCEGYGTFGAGAYDTYEKSTYEDPYMNCILNACDRSKKEEFSYTQETGANSKVCNIYCRKELTFYLANKTKVYAGMQFSYDIASKVIEGEGDIDKVLTTDHKLTSIVLQKRQCTSEIYYNKKNADGQTWIEQYDIAVKNMIAAYNEWKKIEVLYDWEVGNGGPYVIKAIAKNSYESTAKTCGSLGCKTIKNDCSVKTIHTWPEYKYTPNESGEDVIKSRSKFYNTWKINSSCKSTSKGEVVCDNSRGTILPNTLQSGTPNIGVEGCGSEKCCTTFTCKCNNAVKCGKNSSSNCVESEDTMNCCCSSKISTSQSCIDGEDQCIESLYDDELIAWNNFKVSVKAVEQLYYDLQNCNFYVKYDSNNENTKRFPEKISNFYNDLDGEHHKGDNAVYANASAGGSIKDYLLEQSYCKNPDECVSLILGYEDDYGADTKFGKNVKDVESKLNYNYYCKDGKNNKCYAYKQDEEVEIKNGNVTAMHDRIVCSGVGTNAKCSVKKISLPVNDYATFITVTEADFWQPKSYKTSVYTGVVSEDDGSTDAGNSTPLGKEVFPVSNKTKKDKNGKDTSTGIYDVKHKYSNLGLTTDEKFDFEYACNYEVFNTTKYYDCETNENGVTDLTKCKNACYELKNGVPVILDSCNTWTPKDNDSKIYGFIYRNVDVGNLFPGKDIRDTGINWSSKTDVIEAIEKTADKIYTTDDYLEYRYILTPSNIRQIREYNSYQNSNGGYLNETLSNCTMIDDTGGLKSFTECKSSFLDEVKAGKFGNIKVSGSKS